MAKLATQSIVILISKAVSDDSGDTIKFLDAETIAQLKEAVEALSNDAGVVVEMATGD